MPIDLCWIHHFLGGLTQSLSPGLETVDLECWARSCGQSLDFSSFMESCLLASSSGILAESWVLLESLPFSPCPSKRERLSLFLLSSIHSWLKVPLSSQGFPSPLHREGKVQALIFPKCGSYDLYPQNAVAMGSHFLQRLFYLVHLKTLRNGDTLLYSDSLFRLFTKQH